MRDELLNETLFFTIGQARSILARWADNYNTERPHSSLYATPAAFAAELEKQRAGLTPFNPARCFTCARARQQRPVSGCRWMKGGGQVNVAGMTTRSRGRCSEIGLLSGRLRSNAVTLLSNKL